MLKNRSTLIGRVTLWISLLACGLFLTLAAATLLVTLIVEDAMIHNLLRYIDQEEISINSKIQKVSFDELKNMGYQLKNKDDFTKRVNAFGEFASNNQYYHFMILEDNVLLLESTELVTTRARIEGIFKLLSFVFVPCLILILILARLIAKKAMQPFSQLKNTFLSAERSMEDIRQYNEQIKEIDVKQIAEALTQAVQDKESILVEQITFNQGMSHELRTPLQVMTHAIELIALKHPTLTKEDVYVRLVNASNRMHRVSEAMLWLTSNAPVSQSLQVNLSLVDIEKEVTQIFSNHGLIIQVKETDSLYLPIPQEVFEFIVFSLVNNAVHHGKEQAGKKILKIDITTHSICFHNLISETENVQFQTNFGLGLSIVWNLCQRFGLKYEVNQKEQTFSVTVGISTLVA